MCGGKIEIVPCSRVGHIFRTFSPYKWTTTVKLPEYNYKRVAAVWMDHYQELYYDRIGRTGDRREQNIGDYGSVLARKELRESLQCKDFEWWVCDRTCDHIFPQFIMCLYQDLSCVCTRYLREQMPDLHKGVIKGMGEIRCNCLTIILCWQTATKLGSVYLCYRTQKYTYLLFAGILTSSFAWTSRIWSQMLDCLSWFLIATARRATNTGDYEI